MPTETESASVVDQKESGGPPDDDETAANAVEAPPASDGLKAAKEEDEIALGSNGSDAPPPAGDEVNAEANAEETSLAAIPPVEEPAPADAPPAEENAKADDADEDGNDAKVEAPPAKKAKTEVAEEEAFDPAVYGLPPNPDADDDDEPAPAESPAIENESPPEKEPRSDKRVSDQKCSCAKSKCLKLYCECLARGNHCNDDCDCDDCHNAPEHDGEGGLRLESIRYILARKPEALTEEMRAAAHEGGWEPPARPPRKSPLLKKELREAKQQKKIPARSGAGRTVAKAKKNNGRSKDAKKDKKAAANDDDDDDGDIMDEDSDYSEEEAMPAIAFSAEEFPQLTLDQSQDHSNLASSFKRPLFDDNPSRPLEIAYSHHVAAKDRRKLAQKKKNTILKEYNKLREQFMRKKLELSLANDEVKDRTQEVGTWTRKVYDLELEEPCGWNTNYRKLKEYRDEYGRLPSHTKKANDEDEKTLAGWLDRIRNQRNAEEREEDLEKKHNKNKRFVRDYPHRLEALAELGVVWESHHENKWETMFQKLLVYKEEMGTLRFPSDDQCAATGDEDLIALQKWVKSQVTSYRYGKKRNPEVIKKLLDIGFDFEKWYAKPSKNRMMKDEKLDLNNDICSNDIATAGEEVDDVKMPALPVKEEVVGDVGMLEMKIGEVAEVIV